MPIDPVILQTEKIRVTQDLLSNEYLKARKTRTDVRATQITSLSHDLRKMYEELLGLVPTSAMGAAEFVWLAAKQLPFSHERYRVPLRAVADRLRQGQRLHADLVWLRAMKISLQDTGWESDKPRVIELLSRAISGAARPIAIYRAAGQRSEVSTRIEDRVARPY